MRMQINGDLIVSGTNRRLADLCQEEDFCCLEATTKPSLTTTSLEYKDFSVVCQSGGYTFSNGRIRIPKGTKVIELGGSVGGNAFISGELEIRDASTDTLAGETRFNYQFGGNTYFVSAIPTNHFSIDSNKEYTVRLVVRAYNCERAGLNEGFNAASTRIYARRIK